MESIKAFIDAVDRTEDEYIQAYLQGVSDALQLLTEPTEP